MADKKLTDVSVVNDIGTLFGKRSNGEVVQINKSNLAEVLGILPPFTKFAKPYKVVENVSYGNIGNGYAPKGVSLLICYNHENILENYSIMLIMSRGLGEYNPVYTTLLKNNMEVNVGWYGTVNISPEPDFNVTIKSILLG